MSVDVLIVCHTEFGFVRDRAVVFDKRAKEGVTQGAVNLARLADKYGAKVTFAVMPEVAEYFPEEVMKNHEVGLHTHPGWERFVVKGCEYYVGDTYLREHCKQSSGSTVLRDYSYGEQLEMIKAGRDRIREVLEVDATTHVAGRWSINNDTVKALADAGITHDCSATPGKKAAHYDWSRLPRLCMPYHPSADDYQSYGNLSLTEVPISQTLLGFNVNPEEASVAGLPWLKACYDEYRRAGAHTFQMCLHSPCMTDAFFLQTIDGMLMKLKKEATFRLAGDADTSGNNDVSKRVVPYLTALNLTLMKSAVKRLIA